MGIDMKNHIMWILIFCGMQELQASAKKVAAAQQDEIQNTLALVNAIAGSHPGWVQDVLKLKAKQIAKLPDNHCPVARYVAHKYYEDVNFQAIVNTGSSVGCTGNCRDLIDDNKDYSMVYCFGCKDYHGLTELCLCSKDPKEMRLYLDDFIDEQTSAKESSLARAAQRVAKTSSVQQTSASAGSACAPVATQGQSK
jgi:hypothetical protein